MKLLDIPTSMEEEEARPYCVTSRGIWHNHLGLVTNRIYSHINVYSLPWGKYMNRTLLGLLKSGEEYLRTIRYLRS